MVQLKAMPLNSGNRDCRMHVILSIYSPEVDSIYLDLFITAQNISTDLLRIFYMCYRPLISVSVWLQICVECVATEVLLVLHHLSSFQAQLEMMVKKVKQENVEFK